jgi:hypothetical protein
MTRPTTIRRRENADVSRATSRMAATGGIFDARRAGTKAATTVMRTPVTREVTTALVVSTTPPAGMSTPKPASSAFSPTATPMPAASPTAEATIATTNASARTEPSTCRRLAPMARSSAFSRDRWATMIENVL